uniref:Uncharacterized protein n=1 Tax=Rhizophora mucronata TaxID=61149 RepID=A0A2P2KBN9_RHIMU
MLMIIQSPNPMSAQCNQTFDSIRSKLWSMLRCLLLQTKFKTSTIQIACFVRLRDEVVLSTKMGA